MIYNVLIQPYFDYCSPLWDICGKHLLDELQKYQNRGARIIAGVSYEIDSADVLETLGWETLERRRQRMKSVFLYKILNDYTAPNLKQSLVGSYPMTVSYNLRSTDTDIALPKPRREFLKKTFKYSGAKLNLILRVFTFATRATAETLTQAGHVAPKFWVLDIRT